VCVALIPGEDLLVVHPADDDRRGDVQLLSEGFDVP
jgi:hypothetical protein